MSLILDALRKSEAERRRGQVPDLHAELPPISQVAPPRRRLAHAWWIAGALLLAAAGVLVASRWPAGMPIAATPPAPAATPADTIASSGPPPAQVPVEPPLIQTPPEAVAIVTGPPVRPAPPPTSPTSPAVAPAAPPAPEPIDTMPIPPPTVASAPPPPASASDATAPPLRVADLSAGEREQLPPLKISMHMWGPTPEQRFAIIDGTRVGQGDRVGAAVVAEIAADGVILDWQGRRIALPVR
ncbi:general secretion pathway protein GspB [Lysobacter panacisoli]|uniref:Type II secretion system protein GspB C-terminal domain-containing protein n=1 Tax=Lysobacter panacisoli TaxID=1255263 RepID=A0ABP9LL75_9GAMM|nr:general secretion pathway protein GspB [Lysobacter panacisoli]